MATRKLKIGRGNPGITCVHVGDVLRARVHDYVVLAVEGRDGPYQKARLCLARADGHQQRILRINAMSFITNYVSDGGLVVIRQEVSIFDQVHRSAYAPGYE